MVIEYQIDSCRTIIDFCSNTNNWNGSVVSYIRWVTAFKKWNDSAHFHIGGIQQVEIDKLNKSAMGYISIWAASLTYFVSKPSGPGEQLSFKSPMALNTSMGIILLKENEPLGGEAIVELTVT